MSFNVKVLIKLELTKHVLQQIKNHPRYYHRNKIYFKKLNIDPQTLCVPEIFQYVYQFLHPKEINVRDL